MERAALLLPSSTMVGELGFKKSFYAIFLTKTGEVKNMDSCYKTDI